MPKYTSIEQIENYLLLEIEIGFKDQVEEWIDQMEKYIDQETGRNFKADAVVSEKIYDGNGEKHLFIDECVEITKVEIDDVELDPDNYLLYPANELPKTRIKIINDVGEYFVEDEQNIAIEAKWGYSVEPPTDITFVATILVAGMILASEPNNQIRQETLGEYSVAYKDDKQWDDFDRAKKIISNYKKIVVG